MANFSPDATFKTGRKKFAGRRFTFTTQAVRMLKFIFQPGLKFECDYIRFFRPFDWAQISSPVSQIGLEISARAETLHVIANIFLKKICSGSQAEISAC